MNAREVFAGPFEDFVENRKKLVDQAKKSGDRDRARAVAAWRKPTRGAWLVNLLSAHAADEVDEAMGLGELLAEAHRGADPAQLRELSRQRGQLVSALARRAVELAAERGYAVPESVRAEVADTITAGLADPEVAAGIRSGTLSRTVRAAGFGPVDLFAPLAQVIPLRPRVPAQDHPGEAASASRVGQGEQGPRGDRDRRLVELAGALDEAEAEHARASDRADEARSRAARAAEESSAADGERAEAAAAVEAARLALAAAEERLRDADGRSDAASRTRRRADDAADEETRLERRAAEALRALREEAARLMGL